MSIRVDINNSGGCLNVNARPAHCENRPQLSELAGAVVLHLHQNVAGLGDVASLAATAHSEAVARMHAMLSEGGLSGSCTPDDVVQRVARMLADRRHARKGLAHAVEMVEQVRDSMRERATP